MVPLPHVPLGILVLLMGRLQQRLCLLHLTPEGRDGAEKVYSVHHCLSLHQFHAVSGDLVFHLFKGVESCPVPLQADRHYYHADSGFAGGYPPQCEAALSERAETEEAAGYQENQYFYRVVRDLFWSLYYHQVDRAPSFCYHKLLLGNYKQVPHLQ